MIEVFEVDPTAWGSRCQAIDMRPLVGIRRGVERKRCGGYVTTGVSWEGRVEGRHTLLVCERHKAVYGGGVSHERP